MKNEELNILDDALRDKAISLQSLGVDEYGWARPQVQEVFDVLLAEKKAVIGGDVYYEYDGRLESAYANWHCEPKPGEQLDDFVRRSIVYALEYLGKVDDLSGKRAVFVPVVGDVI